MTKGLSGVRADQKRSYRSLEKYACHVREHLKLNPLDALNALQLFENLDEISITMNDGTEIPFRSGLSRWRTLKDMRDTTDPKILSRCSRPNRRTSGLNQEILAPLTSWRMNSGTVSYILISSCA